VTPNVRDETIGNGPLDAILAALAERGPLAYQRLPPDERARRGRYLLMVVSMGASGAFGWANALLDDPVAAEEGRELVAATTDHRIAEELAAAGFNVEDVLAYLTRATAGSARRGGAPRR
jgi:hypothetical protein